MSSNLYLKDTYVAEGINYIISSYIREYDISKANINILLYYGVINQEEFSTILSMDRMERQITVGLMCRNGSPNGKYDGKEVNKILSNGFVEFRRMFFEANEIEDYEVLSIRKDAIFLINKVPTITQFSNVTFLNSEVYTSYYRLSRHLEAYYFRDVINQVEKIDFKGISDNVLVYHKDHMLDFILYIFELAEAGEIETIVTTLSNFYKEYVTYNLDVGYYREFNSNSLIMINNKGVSKFGLQYVEESIDKTKIDIGYNLELLRNMISIFSQIYFGRKS